uniref:Ovule protein n=1 Tax=Parascaris univalens TaxID=6257 RepID=A0A914ZV46_PARUN
YKYSPMTVASDLFPSFVPQRIIHTPFLLNFALSSIPKWFRLHMCAVELFQREETTLMWSIFVVFF